MHLYHMLMKGRGIRHCMFFKTRLNGPRHLTDVNLTTDKAFKVINNKFTEARIGPVSCLARSTAGFAWEVFSGSPPSPTKGSFRLKNHPYLLIHSTTFCQIQHFTLRLLTVVGQFDVGYRCRSFNSFTLRFTEIPVNPFPRIAVTLVTSGSFSVYEIIQGWPNSWNYCFLF